jgi:hypothetical protein
MNGPDAMNPDISGMSVCEVLEFAAAWLDRDFACRAQQLAIALASNGIARDQIEGMLEFEREKFLHDRKEHLAELNDWLIVTHAGRAYAFIERGCAELH